MKIAPTTTQGHYKIEKIINHHFAVEVKCVAQLTATHRLQLQRYLRIQGLDAGMLINFGPTGIDTYKM